MWKKIALISALLIIVILSISIKVYYPNSQWELKNSLNTDISQAANQYQLATEKSCGIWSETKLPQDQTLIGKKNQEVWDCFKNAFEQCLHRNIFIAREQGTGENKNLIYSLIRVVKANDQNDCLIQNAYEQFNLNQPLEEQIPINFINTCTSLADNFSDSCMPEYLNDLTK